MIKNWKNIHQEFTSELQKKWEDNNFTYQQVKEWIDVGVKPTDYQFTIYLRDVLECKPEDALNFADWETLRNQHQEYLQEIPPKQEDCRLCMYGKPTWY